MLLACGERSAGRVAALHRGLELLPDEEAGLRRTLELFRSLPRCPDPLLRDSLPLLVRLSARIAALIDHDAEAAGSTEVRLTGGAAAEPVLAGGGWKASTSLTDGRSPDILPLTDWRGVVHPLAPDDTFAPLSADPADPSALTAAAAVADGPYPTLLADRLLIRPGTALVRTRCRAIQCRATDPVSFALIEGRPLALFPDLRGWSSADTAQRAVDEHWAWLHSNAGRRARVAEEPGAKRRSVNT